MNNQDKVKVLYIAGCGRSGSTIIDRILGQCDGFFSMGEIRYIWERNILENRMCGCGERFQECSVWSEIVNKAFGSIENVDAKEMFNLREKYSRSRHLVNLMLPKPKSFHNNIQPYLDSVDKLYKATKNVTGSRVLVDSSKFPSYAYILSLIPSIELYVLHIVRDPRGVSFSWRKKKIEPSTGEAKPMQEIGPVKSALLWDTWNISTEILMGSDKSRYIFLRYEDFVKHPKRSMQKVLRMLGEDVDLLTFVDDRTVQLGKNHTVSGNPNRFSEGPVEIRLDDAWRNKILFKDRFLTTIFTGPFLGRYKYQIG